MKKTNSHYFRRFASIFLSCLCFSTAASAQGLDQQWQRQNSSQANRDYELDKICKYFVSGKAVGGFSGERFYLNNWKGKPSLMYCVRSGRADISYWPRHEVIVELDKTYKPCPFNPRQKKACMFKLENQNIVEYWSTGKSVQKSEYGELE